MWFAWDLDGSYEEGPPAIIENAQRDRRWCQGNLQHFMLLFARGLHGVSRIHLTMGIVGYLAGPLWFLFMLTGTYVLWYRHNTGLSDVVVSAFTPFIHLDAPGHALLVFGISMGVIFLPKMLSLIDLALDPTRCRAFGGLPRASIGALAETIFSTLHAPIQMLFHSKFVFPTLIGTSVHWCAQKRAADGTAWSTAWKQHWGHTTLGLVWGALTWWLEPAAFWWFVPVLSGMVLSAPLSVMTSREGLGDATRRAGLFVTPEEISTPEELQRLHSSLGIPDKSIVSDTNGENRGLVEAVLDPYVNAIHVSLLRERQLNAETSEGSGETEIRVTPAKALGEKLLAAGTAELTPAEQVVVLSDANVLSWLHREVWTRSTSALAEE